MSIIVYVDSEDVAGKSRLRYGRLPYMRRILEVSPGERYGRGTVICEERLPLTENQIMRGRTIGDRGVRLRCADGNEYVAAIFDIVNGKVVSCGCKHSELGYAMGAGNITHGVTNHEHFSRWSSIKARCYDPTRRSYKHYGGRGIRLHEEWLDARVFCEWMDANLGSCPVGMSLDRIDNDGNYEPGNLRWASATEQYDNRRVQRDDCGVFIEVTD